MLTDSVTCFAMTQREFGLSAGEPPTAKGYTPTELPRFVESAGPGTDQGTITCIFSVMVDGDEHHGPMAYAVRGCYPAINVLKSRSCTMPRAADPAYLPAIDWAKAVVSTYSDMEELIRLGAHAPALTRTKPSLSIRLRKTSSARSRMNRSMMEGYRRLGQILQANETEN